MARRGGDSGSDQRHVEAKARRLTSCEAPLLRHDTERPEVCVLAAPRRGPADEIVPTRMALAAGRGCCRRSFVTVTIWAVGYTRAASLRSDAAEPHH